MPRPPAAATTPAMPAGISSCAGGRPGSQRFGEGVSFRHEAESDSYKQAARMAAKDGIWFWLNALCRDSVSGMPARALRTDGGRPAPVLPAADAAAFAGLAIRCFPLPRKARGQAKGRAEGRAPRTQKTYAHGPAATHAAGPSPPVSSGKFFLMAGCLSLPPAEKGFTRGAPVWYNKRKKPH